MKLPIVVVAGVLLSGVVGAQEQPNLAPKSLRAALSARPGGAEAERLADLEISKELQRNRSIVKIPRIGPFRRGPETATRREASPRRRPLHLKLAFMAKAPL